MFHPLESSVTLGPNVGLLSLPDKEEEYEDGLMCTFIGWGTVSAGGLAPVVQKVGGEATQKFDSLVAGPLSEGGG